MTLSQIINILIKFITKSKILANNQLQHVPEKLGNKQYFGYFSLINLIRIYVLIGQGKKALEYLSLMNFEVIRKVFLKEFSATSSFLYYSGFALLTTGHHKESIKIIENLCLFMK